MTAFSSLSQHMITFEDCCQGGLFQFQRAVADKMHVIDEEVKRFFDRKNHTDLSPQSVDVEYGLHSIRGTLHPTVRLACTYLDQNFHWYRETDHWPSIVFIQADGNVFTVEFSNHTNELQRFECGYGRSWDIAKHGNTYRHYHHRFVCQQVAHSNSDEIVV